MHKPMMKKHYKVTCRLFSVILAGTLFIVGFPAEASDKLSDRYPVSSNDEIVAYQNDPQYTDVLNGWQKGGWETVGTGISIRLHGQDFQSADGKQPEKTSIENEPCILNDTDTAWVDWNFTVDTAGLYVLQIEYYAAGGNGLPIQRGVMIDGAKPYEEAGNIVLPRRFVDDGPPRVNSFGDEVRPMQKEVRSWIARDVSDSQGEFTEPLLWKLEAGTHTLRLQYIDQPVAIAALQFHGISTIPSYEDIQKEYEKQGYKPATQSLTWQAEDVGHIAYKTQSAITVYNDGDPLTKPEGITYIKMNALGGYSWRNGNQEISFTIQVPQTGLYKLAMRVQQVWGNGLTSCRQVLLDGKVPFQEMAAYAFPYDRNWKVRELADSKGLPYQFYLTEGTHTLTFIAKLDPKITQALQIMKNCSEKLSEVIRQITMITGTEPDPNYDYDLEKAIPDLLDTFQNLEDQLKEATDLIMAASNNRPSTVNNLEMICKQFAEMRNRPDSIPKRLEDLNTNLTGLGDWMKDVQSTPLGIDTVGFYPPQEKVPSQTSNILMKIWGTLRNFIVSFSKDYNAIGCFNTDDQSKKVLNVWISRGKEWCSILQELIDSDFTPSSGIGIKLNILPSGTLSSAVNPLLLSINSGKAPDAVLSLANNYPVEYAIRGCVADLSKMDGYEQTVAQFDPKIMTPLKYQGGVYALPETTNFRVLFYRKDIFSQLKLSIPDTWDDVFNNLLPILYQNGMQMFIPSSYDLFLFQYGGKMYTDDCLRSGVDTPQAYAAFDRLISLYLDMGIPITANFYNRFRSGEMPIGIDSYGQYVTLLTAAPELAGKWGIAPLPGTKEDGTVNRSTAVLTGEADILLESSQNKPEAWQFLQWWTSAKTQIAYGSQVEGRIGTYARWNTSNLEAFESLPWNREDLAVIKEQWKWSEDPPTVLGGSYANRYITNALNRCLYSNQSPRDSLEEAVEEINKELQRKQQLYGIFPDSSDNTADMEGGK